MEFYLDLILYAPYVTAALMCLVSCCFYFEARQVVYQTRGYSTSLVVDSSTPQLISGKRRKLFTIAFRKKPTKESALDDEDSSFYFYSAN
jgi:hypothetical protein